MAHPVQTHNEKTMLQQAKQVALTYLTWRWIWFIIPLMLAFVLSGILIKEETLPLLSLGMPSVVGLIWIVAVAKWQFANPRARLLPGFAQSHLLVFGVILLLLFVISPLLVSARQGMNPWGPLAFALLLGGCALVSFLLNRGLFALPMIAICFSGFPGPTHKFWFGNHTTYTAIHVLLALVGSGMVGYCLWYLAQLTEEMDEYQVMPIGGMQLSRVERAEQRRLIGRQIKKQKLLSWFNDRWLDHGIATVPNANRTAKLTQYGIARISGYLAAGLTAIAYALYGILLLRFNFMRQTDSSALQNHPHTMLILFALLPPAAVAGIVLLQHRPRMAQELLHPAMRASYLDSLLFALAKRSLLLWIGLLVGLGFLAFTTDTFPQENTMSLILKFVVLSFAVQIPAFGLCLRLGLWNSQFVYMFGMYAVVGLQMGVISLWWRHQEGWAWPIFSLILLLHILLGSWMIAWARRKWLQAELG